jgi:hypothetical protein
VTVTPERIAYEGSLRALDRQAAALEALRARAGTLLAAAALVASFLGANALDHDPHALGVTIAAIALLAVMALVIAILWPYELTFRLSAKILLEDHAQPDNKTPEWLLEGYLALVMEGHHNRNEKLMKKLSSPTDLTPSRSSIGQQVRLRRCSPTPALPR